MRIVALRVRFGPSLLPPLPHPPRADPCDRFVGSEKRERNQQKKYTITFTHWPATAPCCRFIFFVYLLSFTSRCRFFVAGLTLTPSPCPWGRFSPHHFLVLFRHENDIFPSTLECVPVRFCFHVPRLVVPHDTHCVAIKRETAHRWRRRKASVCLFQSPPCVPHTDHQISIQYQRINQTQDGIIPDAATR